ncbi:DUF4145 domain-containing protein [Rossellomorea marisflavi]|uniref:DUF4145 domain-containing protein n=1 Tax=Rossellomorea marisflavi TaxID=189381 RepID=A0A165LZF8_9BACI|nr:DUF4145 domain-containing protein [Rossellomorea marisflavi]KZE53412.1 hypothetical protein AV649_11670 [Rossellomorea marisflavi]
MFAEEKFICPHCETASIHSWYILYANGGYLGPEKLRKDHYTDGRVETGAVSVCHYCDDICLWKHKEMVYPKNNFMVEDPNPDMPDFIKDLYYEARIILQYSARSSSALLRLALETMLEDNGYKQNKLYDKITALMESENASDELIMAAELIRHYGNSSAHKGFIDLNDDIDTANELFMVINLIAQDQYSKPKRLRALMEKLPASKKEGIEKKLEQVKK